MPENAAQGSDFLNEILGGMGGGDTSPPSAGELLEEIRELLFDNNPPSPPAPSEPRYAGIEEFISDLLGDEPPATQEQQSNAQTTVEPEWEGNVPPVQTDWADFLL